MASVASRKIYVLITLNARMKNIYSHFLFTENLFFFIHTFFSFTFWKILFTQKWIIHTVHDHSSIRVSSNFTVSDKTSSLLGKGFQFFFLTKVFGFDENRGGFSTCRIPNFSPASQALYTDDVIIPPFVRSFFFGVFFVLL